MTKPIGYWWTLGGSLAEVFKQIPEKRHVFGVVYQSEATFDAHWWSHSDTGEKCALFNHHLHTYIGSTHPGVYVRPEEPTPKYRPWTKDEVVVLSARNRLARCKRDGYIFRIRVEDDPDILLDDWELVQYGHSSGGVHYIKLLPCGELADAPPMTIEWRRENP